ncbi:MULTISPECIES: xylulokinase [unclassified Leptolyngbya]|nr:MULTISPECIES: xylulokinase [unclassified Leptolyngbya]MBD1909137.1 xylulokinase [Leptolyngbya sp. FACHB-8]MBD2157511.1 xylulokinase [Leptolyngbya sp. FACHB-16]
MLLGIDLGTGSVKALLLNPDGTVLAEASHTYPVQSPKPGWAETDPEAWWSAVAIAIHQVIAKSSHPVEAIGLSGQMHGAVLADKEGYALRPAILWADMRSSEVLDVYRQLPTDLLTRLSNPITAGMAGPTLLWLRQAEPDTYAATRWVLQPKDWLRLQLTGEVTAEPSDASGTLLYDVQADRWALEVMEALQLRTDWLPPLIPSNRIAGHLTPQAAQHLGLKAGIPVIAGAADTAAAILGSNLLEPGSVQLTVGTGAQIITPLAQPDADSSLRTHLYRAALPQQWYRLAAIQNAGLALEWVRGILGFSWPEVYSEANLVPPGCEGLTFLPYLTGERTPHLDPHAKGSWTGLGLHHTRSHLMWAALEGVAFAIKQGLEAIAPADAPIPHLRLAGGGTLEPAWRQLLATVLQIPLYSITVPAASARGAAILAGLGIGIYGDEQAIPPLSVPSTSTVPEPFTPELEAAWIRFQTLYPALREWRSQLL